MDQVTKALLDYGILGIFTITLIVVVRVLWKLMQRQHEANVARIVTLETAQTKYLTEDRDALTKIVQACTTVIDRNNDLLEKLIDKHPKL